MGYVVNNAYNLVWPNYLRNEGLLFVDEIIIE